MLTELWKETEEKDKIISEVENTLQVAHGRKNPNENLLLILPLRKDRKITKRMTMTKQ